MKTFFGWAIMVFFIHPVFSRPSADTLRVSRQCSLIRELVFQAWKQEFKAVIDIEGKGSHGYQTGANWKFSNEVYMASTVWPGSTKSRVMHYQEENDSVHINTWQYLADFENIENAVTAQQLYSQINLQIVGCPYEVNDTSTLRFQPLPLSKVSPEMPTGIEIASLYELPIADKSKLLTETVMVMIGIEKLRINYRVSIIIEYSKVSNQ